MSCPDCHSRTSSEEYEGVAFDWCETCNWTNYEQRAAESGISVKPSFPGKLPRKSCDLKRKRGIVVSPGVLA